MEENKTTQVSLEQKPVKLNRKQRRAQLALIRRRLKKSSKGKVK